MATGFPSIGGQSGGQGFSLGPAQNIFNGANRLAAESARDVYAGANSGWLATYAADSGIGIYLSYNDGSSDVITAQVLISGTWRDSSTTIAIQGSPGAAGASGSSYFFASDTKRDDFFNIPANRALLEHDLPITVNNGGDAEISYWAGVDGPASYDPDLWFPASFTVSPGSVTLGGVRISEGANALFITNDGTGKTYLAQGGEFDDAGSKATNNVPVLGALVDNPSQPSQDETISASFTSFITTATLDRVLKEFTVYFSTNTSEVTIKVFAGANNTDPLIISATQDMVSGANLITFDSNPRLIPGNEYLTETSTINPSLNIMGTTIDDGIHGPQFFSRNESKSWPYGEVTAASSASSVTLFTDVTDAGSGAIITTVERDAIAALNDMDKILYTVEQSASLPSGADDGVFALVTVGIPSNPKGIYEKSPAGWNVRLDVSASVIAVIDNLASTDGAAALSANQGRALKVLIANNSNFKQFVTLRANLVAGAELDYAFVSPGTNSEPPGIYQSLSSVWALILDMSSMGGSGTVTRDGTTEQYEITQFQGDTDVIEGSGITLVEDDGQRRIPESAIQGYVTPPTNTVSLDGFSGGGENLNQGSRFDKYVNKIAVYSGSANIVFDLPTYGGTDGNGAISGSSDTYDVGDVFAVQNSGSGNVTLRVNSTGGGTISPLGTTTVVVAPGGYAAIVKTATNLLFELLNQAGQNAPTSQANVIATRFEQQGGVGFTQTNSNTQVVALTLADMDLVSGEIYEITWTGQVTTTDASNEAVITISKEILNQSPTIKLTLDQKGIREALSNTPGPEVMILYYTATNTEQVDFTVEIQSYDDLTTVTVASNALKIQRIS